MKDLLLLIILFNSRFVYANEFRSMCKEFIISGSRPVEGSILNACESVKNVYALSCVAYMMVNLTELSEPMINACSLVSCDISLESTKLVMSYDTKLSPEILGLAGSFKTLDQLGCLKNIIQKGVALEKATLFACQ